LYRIPFAHSISQIVLKKLLEWVASITLKDRTGRFVYQYIKTMKIKTLNKRCSGTSFFKKPVLSTWAREPTW